LIDFVAGLGWWWWC